MKEKISTKGLDHALESIMEAPNDQAILTTLASSITAWVAEAQEQVFDDPRAGVDAFIEESIEALRMMSDIGLTLEKKHERELAEEASDRTMKYWDAAKSVMRVYWESDGTKIDSEDLMEALEPMHEIGSELIGEEAWVTSAAIMLTEFVFLAANRFADGGKLTIAGKEYPTDGPHK